MYNGPPGWKPTKMQRFVASVIMIAYVAMVTSAAAYATILLARYLIGGSDA